MKNTLPPALAMLTVLLHVSAAALFGAEPVAVELGQGRVTIRASNVSAAEILKEYGAAGNIEILNLEVLPPNAITLVLDNVPEEIALDTLTRSCGGYLAMRRIDTDDLSKSRFRRIVLVRESKAPPAGSVAPVTLPPPPVEVIEPAPGEVRPRLGPDGKPMDDDQQDAPHHPFEE